MLERGRRLVAIEPTTEIELLVEYLPRDRVGKFPKGGFLLPRVLVLAALSCQQKVYNLRLCTCEALMDCAKERYCGETVRQWLPRKVKLPQYGLASSGSEFVEPTKISLKIGLDKRVLELFPSGIIARLTALTLSCAAGARVPKFARHAACRQ